MPRALIADDEPTVRAVLVDICEDNGIDVIEAEDGEMALEKFHQGNCDVLITDLRMPKMDGFKLMAEIKKANPRLPIIIISGYSDEFETSNSNYVIEKPFKEDELVKKLKALNVI